MARIEKDELFAESRRRTECEDYGDGAIESRLSALVQSLNAEAQLHPVGRFLARGHLRDLLSTRLRLERAWAESGDRNGARIEQPVFITGMPRSGSSFLQELLNQDPANRSPLVWEVMFPPAVGRSSERARIWRTAACLWCFRQLSPSADSVYPVRATTPHECIAIHSYTMLSREFVTTFRLPSYKAFMNTVDFSPAYVWEKRFLQHLQQSGGGRRWILKAPDHAFNLEALLKVFPDALIVQLHRNPFDALESSIRMIEVVRRTFASNIDRSELALGEAHELSEGMNRITQFRDTHPELSDQFMDITYDEIASHASEVVRRIYRRLGVPLSITVMNRIQALAASRSRYQGARTTHTLKEMGLDYQVVTERFAGYCSRFSIPMA